MFNHDDMEMIKSKVYTEERREEVPVDNLIANTYDCISKHGYKKWTETSLKK